MGQRKGGEGSGGGHQRKEVNGEGGRKRNCRSAGGSVYRFFHSTLCTCTSRTGGSALYFVPYIAQGFFALDER